MLMLHTRLTEPTTLEQKEYKCEYGEARTFRALLAGAYMVPDFSMWEKYMFGRGGQHNIDMRYFHMDKMTRATMIRRLLLERDRFEWAWEDPTLRNSVTTEGQGWNARILSPRLPFLSGWHPFARPSEYLEHCRRHRQGHYIEVCLDGFGVVLSIHCEDSAPKTIEFVQGEWEAEIFHLQTYRSKNPGRISRRQQERLAVAIHQRESTLVY